MLTKGKSQHSGFTSINQEFTQDNYPVALVWFKSFKYGEILLNYKPLQNHLSIAASPKKQ